MEDRPTYLLQKYELFNTIAKIDALNESLVLVRNMVVTEEMLLDSDFEELVTELCDKLNHLEHVVLPEFGIDGVLF